MAIYKSIEELVGKTPILELKNIKKKYQLKADIFAKLEYLNPAGSVKDRVGKAMLDDAEKRGILKKDSVIIEPTSGNTGIGIAAVGAARGYRVIIVMPETMSEERKLLMKAFGAELILTKGSEGMSGAIKKAEELNKEIPGSFIAGQFVNPANAKAHFDTTGPEIYEDMNGEIDIFVAGIGTGGTITGTGRYLKSKNKDIRIVGVEPAASPFITSGKSGPHGIQGIGAGFIPDVLDTEILDEVVTVEDAEAFEIARNMGKTEGFLIGISSGAALYTAIKLAAMDENEGKKIVVILPDSGSRYLSSGLYD
ncbi:MAG: cysteine synthase A [Clostridia bacterium]|nr:cysteine synthase A [Clostridia bacterium]